MRPSIAFLSLAVTLTALPLAVPPAGAADPTCLGRSATIVGKPGRHVTGTAGPDVIVTGGAATVTAGAGDDLVCTTGRGAVSVELGAGTDRFLGGPGPDRVAGGLEGLRGDGDGDLSAVDPEVDVIVTRGGDDRVQVGQVGLPLADRVDTGAGDDLVLAYGAGTAADAVLTLGTGRDFLSPMRADDGHVVLLDNRVGELTDGSGERWRWTGAEGFSLDPEQAVDFVGGPADETIGAASLRSATLGPGDDEVSLTLTQEAPTTLLGGPGRDRLGLDVTGSVEVDLAHGVVARTGAVDLPAGGFEDLRLLAGRAEVIGTDGPNAIVVSSCATTVLARGGADRVDVNPMSGELGCRDTRSTVRGGRGADRMTGYGGQDRLYGGQGRDVAVGGGGRDTCRAERVRSCER